MNEIAQEEKLSPYFCKRCTHTFLLLWSEAVPNWPYKCPNCGKEGKKMSAIFFGKIRIEELPENKYLTYKEFAAAERRKKKKI